MIPLAIGTTLALAALVFVMFPLFRAPLGFAPTRAQESVAADVSAVDALREIEFDHATGKLSESDYAELKALYTTRALAAMRGTSHACPVHGPRPESDARFCSDCGRALAA